MGSPMASTNAMCSGRRAVVILFSISAILLVAGVLFSMSMSQESWDRLEDHLGSTPNNQTSTSPTEIYNCADPYRRPGYLYMDHHERKNARWIPYTDDFLDADLPSAAEYPRPAGQQVVFNISEVEKTYTESKSTPPMRMLAVIEEDQRRRESVSVAFKDQTVEDFVGMKDEGHLGWLWGRRVLILGDSVDRFMIQFFCEELGRQMHQPAPHTTATCVIPTFNLTLIHWHHAGSWTYRPDWWWMDDMKEIAFEERWTKMWEPMVDTTVRGPTGKPDLILWQSGLWDQRALWECAEANYDEKDPMAQRERHLEWDEIRFIATRVRKLVRLLTDQFGPDVPTMFRAITVHQESNARDANIYELERLSRAIAEKAGHEMFEWARILTAFSMLYKDQTHPGKGTASWLWANMILDYVARSAGSGDEDRAPYFDSWDACHDQLLGWGGR